VFLYSKISDAVAAVQFSFCAVAVFYPAVGFLVTIGVLVFIFTHARKVLPHVRLCQEYAGAMWTLVMPNAVGVFRHFFLSLFI
jgi:hypothetical protein